MLVQKSWAISIVVSIISIILACYYTWIRNSSLTIPRIHQFYAPSTTFSSLPFKTPQTSLTTNPSTQGSINCTYPPPHTCTFYSACLESHFHCGPEGYPLGFGEKFCTKFSLPDNVNRLSRKGEEWMWTTMACLQRALVPELDKVVPAGQGDKRACQALKDKAFSTHAPCYLTSGLCSLPPEDWVVIVEVINVRTLFSSWDAFIGGVEAGEGCLEFFSKA
ncbi:hypothetical protein EV361DRAFT_876085 [Lentinula raphanica]|nr:hypothetical protein EV361DRAFT_876085 [Lentinula raphanica]